MKEVPESMIAERPVKPADLPSTPASATGISQKPLEFLIAEM